jgi:hypothetical protein
MVLVSWVVRWFKRILMIVGLVALLAFIISHVGGCSCGSLGGLIPPGR